MIIISLETLIISIVTIILVFLIIAALAYGDILKAALLTLVVVGLVAINGPLYDYIRHIDIKSEL